MLEVFWSINFLAVFLEPRDLRCHKWLMVASRRSWVLNFDRQWSPMDVEISGVIISEIFRRKWGFLWSSLQAEVTNGHVGVSSPRWGFVFKPRSSGDCQTLKLCWWRRGSSLKWAISLLCQRGNQRQQVIIRQNHRLFQIVISSTIY